MEPLFSIITPVYNGQKFIEKTIQSVVGQTSKNFEYIIVDGKSTDQTMKIIENYKKKIDLIISEDDSGMYEAIDKGIKRAKGKYILWLNSDDILVNADVIKKLSKFLINNLNINWIVGRNSFLKENNEKVKSFISYIYPRWVVKNGFAHSCGWGFIQQESVVFSRSIYYKVGGLDKQYKMAGDFYLWKKFALVNNLLSCNLLVGAQRKWHGQMQGNLNFYYKEINKKKCQYVFFRYFRILLSILLFPIIYFRK